MKKNNNITYIVVALLSSGVIVFLCLFLHYFNSSKEYKVTLENNYRKSFYEVIDNVNSLEIDLSKLVATNDKNAQRDLLSGIYNTSTLSINNVNVLPITYDKLTKINMILNKTSGFSYSLLDKIYEGNNVSNVDYDQLVSLHTTLLEIKYDLNSYLQNWQYDYSIIDNIDSDGSNFTAGVINTESSKAEVPSLIYDGPFSDSVINREIVGLGSIVYSESDALEYLTSLFDGNIKYIGTTLGKFETYDFVVDQKTNVSVTKQGGFLLTITSYGDGGESTISVEDAIDIAREFASNAGFEDMHSVWFQSTGGMLYINLAPIVDSVIHYSDLIKVKVDLASGKVVGWEATNYATNHQTRIFTESVGLTNALSKLSPVLEVKERNYCIVPDKYVGEASAYEFICTWKNYTYYVYIDSNTGAEVNILRVIDTSNGELLQ